MIINLGKTTDVISIILKSYLTALLPLFLALNSVQQLSCLVFTFKKIFSCNMHFKHIITVSSQRLHILKALRRQGHCLELLHCVFHAIIVNNTMYAMAAWYGFLNKSHVLQINSLFKCAFMYGYVKSVIQTEQLLQDL